MARPRKEWPKRKPPRRDWRKLRSRAGDCLLWGSLVLLALVVGLAWWWDQGQVFARMNW